ncbi:MAG: hypothetical protein SH868_19790 [Bythopirellula sp.]|nr:hypothetical protein [Bythopirellula sp.]
MARHAQDREDLLRDAKALVPRVQLRLPILGKVCDVFAGFRTGAASLYFDSDPVYQFNSAGELRRAFVDDCIVKAAAGRLKVWKTLRTPTEVTMQSHFMAPEEVEKLRGDLLARRDELQGAIERKEFELVGQVPNDSNAVDQLLAWLAARREFKIAAVANVK